MTFTMRIPRFARLTLWFAAGLNLATQPEPRPTPSPKAITDDAVLSYTGYLPLIPVIREAALELVFWFVSR